jgi:hypothetical protein
MSLKRAASEMGTTHHHLSERRKGLCQGGGVVAKYDATIIAWCEGIGNNSENDGLIRDSDKLEIDENMTAHANRFSSSGMRTLFAKQKNKCSGVPLALFNRAVTNKVYQPEGADPLAIVLNSTGTAQLTDGDSVHSRNCCSEGGFLNARTKRCTACDDACDVWKGLRPQDDPASKLKQETATNEELQKKLRAVKKRDKRKEKRIGRLLAEATIHKTEKKRMLNTNPDANGNRVIFVEGRKSNDPLVAAVACAVTSGWLTEDMFLYRFILCQMDALRQHVKGKMRGMKWGQKHRDIVEFFQALRMCGDKVTNIMRGCASYKDSKPNLFLPCQSTMKAFTPEITIKPGLAAGHYLDNVVEAARRLKCKFLPNGMLTVILGDDEMDINECLQPIWNGGDLLVVGGMNGTMTVGEFMSTVQQNGEESCSFPGNLVASKVMLIMIQDAEKKFSVPIAWFPTRGDSSTDYAKIRLDVAAHLEAHNIKVIAIVGDAASQNKKFMRDYIDRFMMFVDYPHVSYS